jgi:chemotaxis protein methyltransferase CheR
MINSKPFSDKSLRLLLDLIHERTGLHYENGRVDLVVDKLYPLLLERGMESYLDYYYYLKYEQDVDVEWRRLETALAVNESYFWREYDQFEIVVNRVVPHLQQTQPDRKIRIWHAGCATGEEPYTMVISLYEAGRFFYSPIEVIATDMNIDAIAVARAGIYRKRSFRSIPDRIKQKYFREVETDRYQLSNSIRGLVQFYHLNLMDAEGMSSMNDVDIIFCRNVFIYFSKDSLAKVASYFNKSLRSPGYLFTGSAESLLKITTSFEFTDLDGIPVYKKV